MEKITTKTKTGVKVELEINKVGRCIATAHLPLDKVSGIAKWGERDGKSGILMDGVMVGKKRMNVCMLIPESDWLPIAEELEKREAARKEAEKKEGEERREKALSECPNDCVIARCLWSNGDLMSGKYRTEDGIEILGPDMMENHYGWYFITKKSVEGRKEEMKVEKERKAEQEIIKAANKKEEEIKTAKIFEIAKETGEKQYLYSYSVDCTDRHEECNTDIVTVWAMPDGTRKQTQVHTW